MKSQNLVVAALIVLAPGAAAAQSQEARPPVAVIVSPTEAPPPRPSMITNPSWARQPRLTYPEAALNAGIEGSVNMRCVVSREGLLVDCEVLGDVRPGYGFAEAALEGATTARVSPRTVDGLAEDARATWTATFRLPEEPEMPGPTPRLYDANGTAIPDGERMWAVLPSISESDFTSRFLDSGRSGSATLACTVQSDGALTDCRVEAESPRRLGVGASAIRVARRGRLRGPILPDVTGRQPTARFTVSFPAG